MDVVMEKELSVEKKVRYLQLFFGCSRGTPKDPKFNRGGL